MNKPKIWTDAEKAELKAMILSGKNNKVIADHFGTTIEKIHGKRSRMGLTVEKLAGKTQKAPAPAKKPVPKQAAPLAKAVAKKKAAPAAKAPKVKVEINVNLRPEGSYLSVTALGNSLQAMAKAIEDAAVEVQERAR